MLFSIRTLAIFFILLLFLDPTLKRVISRVEPPIIGIAFDNSQSIIARNDDSLTIRSNLDQIQQQLEAEDLAVEIRSLSDDKPFRFDSKTSNLSTLLAFFDDNQEKNHVATLLFTDGIYNRGASPLYKNYVYPIYTVGMGDTVPPKDISISRVRYNRVSYNGNQTPIKVEISQEGYNGSRLAVSLSEKGKVLATKEVTLQGSVEEIQFLITNEKEELRHLIISAAEQADESTVENNLGDVFLEVIDGSQKVLIVAASPHPDIKAIRSSLEETDSYETSLYIPAVDPRQPTDVFDVVIYHGAFNSRLNFTPKDNPGIWYIVNSQSSLRALDQALPYLKITRKGGQPDDVTGSFNQNFSKFKIENADMFENYPPMQVPYADYFVSGSSEVLMYQQLGSVVTNKPLMVIYDNGVNKSATLMGQDIWKWKLQEAAINENSENFNEFVTKTVQYLSVKNDKKQFRFIPRSATFQDDSPVLFDAEVYNDIYERIYGNEISITVSNEQRESQNYTFVPSELNSTFQAPNLPPGIYQFESSVQVGSERFVERGEFLIENINTEYIDLTANHRMLKNLAAKTSGEYFHYSELEKLVDSIKERGFKSVIKSEEDTQKLATIWWWYVLTFSLFSAEWFLRRYWGGY